MGMIRMMLLGRRGGRSFLRDSVSVHAGLTGEMYLQDWQEFGKKKTVELNVRCTYTILKLTSCFMQQTHQKC